MPTLDPLDRQRTRILQSLEDGAAAIFYAKIDDLEFLEPLITTTETEKFNRVVVERQRRAHIFGRTLVRYMLDLPILDFDQQSNGKPSFGAIHFNIAHSQHAIAVAFHKTYALGIDIETRYRKREAENLIDMVCHPNEKSWISKQNRDDQGLGFLRMWVRKEALLKCAGLGLIDELDSIDTRLEKQYPTIGFEAPMRLWDFDCKSDELIGSLATNSTVQRVVLTCLNRRELLAL